MQIMGDHGTLFILCHVGIHVDVLSMINVVRPLGLRLLVGSEFGWSWPFQPMILECEDHGPLVSCGSGPDSSLSRNT
jgi:hypothetical protein